MDRLAPDQSKHPLVSTPWPRTHTQLKFILFAVPPTKTLTAACSLLPSCPGVCFRMLLRLSARVVIVRLS
jgi:hypothetical protein